jgi:hypothetical protein
VEDFQALMQAEDELLMNFEDSQFTLEPKITEELVLIHVPCSVN